MSNAITKRAPTQMALEGWIMETLPKLDAEDRAEVRHALRVLSMKVVMPTVLLDLPHMKPGEKIQLLKAILSMGLATGGKDGGGPKEAARVVYVLPD